LKDMSDCVIHYVIRTGRLTRTVVMVLLVAIAVLVTVCVDVGIDRQLQAEDRAAPV